MYFQWKLGTEADIIQTAYLTKSFLFTEFKKLFRLFLEIPLYMKQITLCKMCAVPWVISWCMLEDILSTVGMFSTVEISWVPKEVFSTMGDIMSTMWDIISTMGVILSTVWDIQYHEGYHDACGAFLEYCGGVQYHGRIPSFVIWVPWEISWIPWGYSNNKRVSPTVLNTPMVLMISPTALSIPHSPQDNPHIYHDIPHGAEHLPRYSRYLPTCILISPMVLNIPHGTTHTLYRVQIEQADFPNWVGYKQVLAVSYVNACPFCYFKYNYY